MGKTKFGTKIVFVFVILLGAGAVLYAKNCMEQLAAYAVSLMGGTEQAQAQSQLAEMIGSDVKKWQSLWRQDSPSRSLWVLWASLITSGASTLHAAIRTPSHRRFYTGCGTKIHGEERQHRKPCGSFPQDPGELCGTPWEREGQCRVPERHVSSIGKNVDEINGEMEGISATTQQLAASMEESAASATEMNTMSEEINRAIKNIAESAQEGAERVNDIHTRAINAKRETTENRANAQRMHGEIKESLDQTLQDVEVVSRIESWHRRSWRSPTRPIFYP